MAGLIYNLLEQVEKQISVCDELISLAKTKKDLIIHNDISELSKLQASENAAVGRFNKTDKEITALMKDIAMVLGEKLGSITLTSLCNIIREQKESRALEKYISVISSKIEELKTLNAYNKILIENSLEYIDYSMNVIRSSLMENPSFYNIDGKEIGSGKGFFDAKQ